MTNTTDKDNAPAKRGNATQDALNVLKAQHREVERLFARFEDAEDDDDDAQEIARLVCQKLTVHATIEEEIFYPVVQRLEGMEDAVSEALEEHLSVKRLVSDIEQLGAGDEYLTAKMEVLKEQVELHVDEEENELFLDVKDAIAEEERVTLGGRLLARTEELEEAAEISPSLSSGMDEGTSRGEARHG